MNQEYQAYLLRYYLYLKERSEKNKKLIKIKREFAESIKKY